MKYVYKGPTFSFISMWDTVGLLDVQQQYSNNNSFLLTRFGLHRPNSREKEVKLVLELQLFYRPMRSPFIWSAGLVYRL